MAENFTTLGLDASALIGELTKVTTAFKSHNSVIDEVAIGYVEYNKQGEAVRATAELILDSGQKLDVMLKKVKGSWDAYVTGVDNATKAMKDAASQKEILAGALPAKNLLQGAGIDTQGLKASLLDAFSGVQLNLSKLLGADPGNTAIAKEIFDKLKQGVVEVETGVRGKIQAALLDVLRLAERINAEQAKINKPVVQGPQQLTGQQLGSLKDQLATIYPPVPGATLASVSAYQAALNNLIALIARNKLTLKEFYDLFNKIARNPAGDFAGTNASLAQVQQGIQKVIISYQQMSQSSQNAGQTGTQAARSLFVSFDQLVRLLEVQVIHRFFGNLITEIQQSISHAAELSLKIAEVQTIASRGFDQSRLTSIVRGASEQFGREQTEVVEGLYQAFSNQAIRSSADINTFNQALRLSQITVSSVDDSVNGLTAVLNSYRLSTLDAERVSNSLFKAVELGRFRMSELGNSLGRVSPLSAQLGVNLNELLGVLSHLTNQGIRFTEAETQINALLTAFLRPSAEMRTILREWGFASGEAAIRTLGLAGAIQRLNSIVESGRAGASELTPNVRAIRALAGTRDLDAVRDFTNQIENSAPSADRAQQIVQQNFGQVWRVEMQKIKNEFTGFGESIIREIQRIAEPWGGVSNAVKVATAALKEIVTTGLSVVNTLNQIASWVTKLTGGDLGTLIKLWIDYKLALYAIAAAQAIVTTAQSYYAAAQAAGIVATNASTQALVLERLARYTSAAAITGETGALVTNTAAKGANAAASGAAATGFGGLAASAGAAVLPLLAVGVVIAAWTGQLDPIIRKWTELGQSMEQIDQINQRITRGQAEFDNQARRDLADRERRFNETLQAVQARGGDVFQELTRRATEVVEAQRTLVANTTENMRVALRGISDEMRNTLADLQRQISEARNHARESIRRGLSFADRDQADAFRQQFDALSRKPEVVRPIDTTSQNGYEQLRIEEAKFNIERQQHAQQQQLIQQRINDLQRQAQQLVANGDEESMQSARRKFEEIRRLTEQSFNLQTEFSRRSAEYDVLTGRANPTDGILRYQVPLQQLQQQLQQLTQQENAAEAAHRARLEAGRRAAEAQLASERQRQQLLNDSIRQLEQLRVVDDQGRLRERFRGPQGLQNFEADFNAARNRLNQALEGGNFSSDARLQALQALATQYGALRAQIEREAAAQAVQNEQNLQQQRLENVRRLRQEAAGVQTDFQQTRSQFLNTLGTNIAEMSRQAEGAVRLITGFNAIDPRNSRAEVRNINALIQAFQQTIGPLNQARETFRQDQGTEREAESFRRLQDAIRATDQAYRQLFGQAGNRTLLGSDQTGNQVRNTETNILQNANALQTHYEAVQRANAQLRNAEQTVQGLGAQVNQAANQLGLAAQNLNGLGAAANNNAAAVRNFAQSIQQLADQLERLRNAPAIPRANGDVSFEQESYAEGGLIGGKFNTFGPDNMLASVRTGEFIVNPDATRRFYSQLVAINSGRLPSFAKGGVVGSSVTNVGDISINVHDSGDPNATARAVLGVLKREMRRGNGGV